MFRKSLTFWLRNDISFFAEGSFESILIELKFDKINIICGVIYSPPNHNFDTNNTFMSNLSALLLKLKNEKKIVFLMGDFNRNMLNPDNQTNAFVDKFFSFGFFPLINKSTRISTAATLIDNIWTNILKYVTKSAIVVDLIADHFGVIQSTTFTNCFVQKIPCTQIRFFSNKNVKKFLNQLQNISWEEIYGDRDPDHAFNKLFCKIQSCFNESFPLCNASKKKSKL